MCQMLVVKHETRTFQVTLEFNYLVQSYVTMVFVIHWLSRWFTLNIVSSTLAKFLRNVLHFNVIDIINAMEQRPVYYKRFIVDLLESVNTNGWSGHTSV